MEFGGKLDQCVGGDSIERKDANMTVQIYSYSVSLDQASQTHSTKGHVAAGFHSNQAGAHQT